MASAGHPGHPDGPGQADQDFQKGAVEDDRPTETPQQGNRSAPGLNDQGMPNNPVAIAQDVVGANEDGTQG